MSLKYVFFDVVLDGALVAVIKVVLKFDLKRSLMGHLGAGVSVGARNLPRSYLFSNPTSRPRQFVQ